MDYALALAVDYVHMPHAWIAVIVPGLLSLLAIARFRRTWTSSPWTVLLVAVGTAFTWWSAWWVETPTTLGLHFYPAALIALLVAWCGRIVKASSLAQASSWAACLAGFTWISLVPADVGGCMARDNCAVVSVGGAGLADMLVLCPAVAFAAVILLWTANRQLRYKVSSS